MIKILFTDIDGVLVHNIAEPINREMAVAIKKASSKIHISFCTGRSKLDTWPIVQACGLENEYHILESGTKVLAPGGVWDYIKPIDIGLIPEILSITQPDREEYSVCIDGIWKSIPDRLDPASSITVLSINTASNLQTDTVVRNLQKYSSKLHIGVGTHYAHEQHGACIHLTDIQANKAYGVRHIQKKLGLSQQESAAIGDMPMDEVFFRECSYIFAPENAHEEVKKKAHRIVPSVDNHGYIQALEQLTGEKRSIPLQ
jgi:HAD superfamily hydrolase (TIGR01484 family)